MNDSDLAEKAQGILEKLKKVKQGLSVLASNKTSEYDWTSGRATATAHRVLEGIQQSILSLEESLDTVEVPRQEHVIGKDARNIIQESHESFGVVEITRPSGSMRLVGTTIDSLPTSVRLKIFRGVRLINPNTHTESYYHEELRPLVDLEMSTYQWAEAICGMTGMANPCTLRTVMGVRMEPVPDSVTTPMEQIINDTKEALSTEKSTENFKADIEALVAKLPELKLPSKKAAEMEKSIRDIYANHMEAPKRQAKWASQRFVEDTEAAVTQAKVEMDAAIGALVNRTGLSVLKGELKGFRIVPSLDASKEEFVDVQE